MNKKVNFSKLIDNNKFLKLLSILIAIVVWFIVSIKIDPVTSVYIDYIPIQFTLTDTTPGKNELSIIEGEQQTVSVKVEGKRYKLGNLTKDDFIAEPSLNAITDPGEYEIVVKIKKAKEIDSDYTIESNLKTVKVKFDRIMTTTLPISAVAENVKAEDGFYKEDTYADTETITLKGPESEINKIAKCVVSTDETKVINETTYFNGKLDFWDKENNKINFKYTKYTVEGYHITVLIYKSKTVPIKVNFVNAPQGLDMSKVKYTLSTPNIEIAGAKGLIDDIKEITLDGEIDFRKMDVGYSPELNVSLVAGVKNTQNVEKVTVNFDVLDLESKTFTIENIITKNEPANSKTKVQTKFIYNVKIVGNKADLEKLSSNDLIAVVDLTNASKGSSRIPVSIYSTGNKFAWAVGDYSVLVSVENK